MTNPSKTVSPQSQRARPAGWPVGSFSEYSQARQAVAMLAKDDFPVEMLTIVGVDLMEVERVIGRWSFVRSFLPLTVQAIWTGLMVSALLYLFDSTYWIHGGVAVAIVGIVLFLLRGRNEEFASTTQLVANRYDILCAPERAPEARDKIALFARKL